MILGSTVAGPVVVPDGDAVGAALRDAVAAGHAVVITTGGTGLNPRTTRPSRPEGVVERRGAAARGRDRSVRR